MAIVRIEKEVKSDVNSANNYVKNTVLGPNESLDMLNNSNDDYSYDFAEDNSAGMGNGKIKNEVGIINICITTIIRSVIMSIINLVIWGGIIFSLLYFTGWISLVKDLALKGIDYVGETIFSFIIAGLVLLFVCFIVKLNINGTIKSRFKYKYLSTLNIYIYEGFVVIYNILFFVIIGFLFFWLVDNCNEVFSLLESVSFVNTSNITIKNIEYFKFVIVIIVAIALTLNSIKGVSIVHKKNKFVLEDQI